MEYRSVKIRLLRNRPFHLITLRRGGCRRGGSESRGERGQCFISALVSFRGFRCTCYGLEDFMNGDHTWFERSDTRGGIPTSASQLSDRREEKRGKQGRGGDARGKGEDEGGRGTVPVDVTEQKKRWNSVVYPVIYNWKLGTTTRPKAIRRFHSGESPFSVLPKVVRPSTRIDARSPIPSSLTSSSSSSPYSTTTTSLLLPQQCLFFPPRS